MLLFLFKFFNYQIHLCMLFSFSHISAKHILFTINIHRYHSNIFWKMKQTIFLFMIHIGYYKIVQIWTYLPICAFIWHNWITKEKKQKTLFLSFSLCVVWMPHMMPFRLQLCTKDFLNILRKESFFSLNKAQQRHESIFTVQFLSLCRSRCHFNDVFLQFIYK